MDLVHLRYFETIARCGSISAAARGLRLSQPTLTVAMKHLEEHLGTTLFLRGRAGVSLTASGDELLRDAAEIFALVERTEQRILGLEAEEVGSFVIGCHESLGAYFLPGFMSAFLRAAPRIEVSLWNGTSTAVAEAVLARQVHYGLIVNPRPHPELVLVKLFFDAMDLFIATSNDDEKKAAARGKRRKRTTTSTAAADLDAAEHRLRTGRLIYAGRVAQCQELINRLAALGLLPTQMLACGDLELVKSLALAGLGVALLPRRVAAYGQPGKLRRLHPSLPFIPDTICLAYRADMHKTRAARRLKDELVAYGKRLEA